MGKLKVTKQSKTGKNLRFTDTTTGRNMSLSQAITAVKNGKYNNYHVRKTKSGDIIASNPDGSKNNNLN